MPFINGIVVIPYINNLSLTDSHLGVKITDMCCHTTHEYEINNNVILARKTSDGQIIEIQFEGEKISNVEESHVSIHPDSSLPYACSGFFDLQVNGYEGYDYNSADLRLSDICSIISALAKSGTVRHLPTIITGPRERTCRNLEIISEAVKDSQIVANAIPGIHLEGPYISEVDGPRGVHDVQYVRNPDIQ